MLFVSYVIDENFQIRNFVCEAAAPVDDPALLESLPIAEKIVEGFLEFYCSFN